MTWGRGQVRPGWLPTMAALPLVAGLWLAALPEVARAGSPGEALLEALERGPGPSKGSAGAPVTIVEFSDFQCSYCRKFWRETLPRLDEKYLQTGKARFVYRHLAILGPPSVRAAMASECAHDQGKFWPYHDRLFGTAGPLGFSADRLKRSAQELGLDTGRFNACLDGGQHREKVERETLVGRAIGITGTPGFLIRGGLLIGAQPYEVFERILEPILKDGGSDKPPAR
ncbi:MAG: DsbA family protein [Candidatus Methylomirabilales bacterium]